MVATGGPPTRTTNWATWGVVAALLLAIGLYLIIPVEWRAGFTTVVVALGAWWAAAMALRRARRGPERRPWMLIAWGLASIAVGESAWAVSQLVLGRDLPTLSLADLAYYVGYGFIVAAFAVWMPRGHANATRRFLEAVLLAGALATVLWALFVSEIASVSGLRDVQGLVTSGYPIVGAALISLYFVLAQAVPAMRRGSPRLLTLGFLLWAVADSGYAYQETHGGFASGLPLDLAWLAGYGSVGLAALVQPAPPGKVRQLMAGLFEPHASIQDATARREARLTATTSAILFVILAASIPIFRALDPTPSAIWEEPADSIGTLLGVFMAAMYWLARSRHALLATILTSAALEIGLVASAASNAGSPFGDGTLFLLVIPPLVATFLVSPISGLALAWGNAGFVLILGAQSGNSIAAYLAVALLIALGAVLSLGASMWRNDLRATQKALAFVEETQVVAKMGSWEIDLATGNQHGTQENRRLFALAPDEAEIRENILRHIHPDDYAAVQATLERASASGREVLDIRILLPDGGIRWLRNHVIARLDEDGNPVRVVGFSQDITEEKRSQEEAKEAAVLREATKFKTQFLNNAAHELANPLTPLKLQLATLRRHAAKWSEPERKSVDLLERNVNRLGVLVNDLLDAARLQGGRLRLRPAATSLRTLLENVHESLKTLAEEMGVRLGTELPTHDVQATVDQDRLTQVLFNLTHNALKFTPKEGEVVLSLRQDGDHAVLAVRDSGIGLDPDQIKQLFQPFTQVHDPSVLKVGGTGLGLYISRGIVEQHQGTLDITSPGRGKGSTFAVRLPLAPPPAPPTAT